MSLANMYSLSNAQTDLGGGGVWKGNLGVNVADRHSYTIL